MFDDMMKIKIAVEGMKAEIVEAFSAEEVSACIKTAADKAVADFDMETYIKDTLRYVLGDAQDKAIEILCERYGPRWAEEISTIIDNKIGEALKKEKTT